MTFTEAIKKGFGTVNKNWQLVLIQIGAVFASFIGFFILIGLPLAIAFIIFGLDLTELSRLEDVFRTLREPSELIARYFGLVILLLASFLLYIMVALALWIFVFGGSIGVMSRSIKEGLEGFSIKVFFSEGRRLFFPLIWFTTMVGLIFIALAFVLGLFGGSIAAIISSAKEQGATLALFLGIFFSIILFIIGITLILTTLSVTIYGAAIMAIRGFGPVNSMKEALSYLYKHADAFYLYCMVFVGYIVISFFAVFLGYPLRFIPLLGTLMSFAYQLAVYVVQSYLGLVMIATIVCYYYFSTAEGPFVESTSASSTPEIGISLPQAPGHEDTPPEKAGSE
ncbi:MAG: hypothetical protein OHK0032_03440 [Thermodesulfovibrionales bacterium]